MASTTALDRKYLLLEPCYPGIQLRKLSQEKYISKKNLLRRQSFCLLKAEIDLTNPIDDVSIRKPSNPNEESLLLPPISKHRKGKSIDESLSVKSSTNVLKGKLWKRKIVGVRRSVDACENVVRKCNRLSF